MKIFEIPVYSMSESKFSEYYNQFIRRQVGDNDFCLEQVKQIYYPQGVWEYNQVIGYIQINADTTRQDIRFVVFKHCKKVYPIRKEKNIYRI